MPRKKSFSYHLSIQEKKYILAICDNMPTATQQQMAEVASRFLSRPVSRITIRTLTKVRRDDHDKCNSKGISNKVRVLDKVHGRGTCTYSATLKRTCQIG